VHPDSDSSLHIAQLLTHLKHSSLVFLMTTVSGNTIALQPNPVSIRHLEEHPSPSLLFPSSHSSTPVLELSPQTKIHLSAYVKSPPLHSNPISSLHNLEHPSSSTRFPSSQSSYATTFMASPH
jgi:hypothetical protein